MTDEEWKAIKGLEWSQQQMRLGNLPIYNQGHYANIRIVLNLIEKQSKEIEGLNYIKRSFDYCVEQENKKWEDKIKAKTIEIKNRVVKDEFITASQGKLNTIIDMESLLEKE